MEPGSDLETTKPVIEFEDFAKLDLRVATVVAAEPHANADRLLKLRIDLGGQERQVCAGIRSSYDPESLIGRRIVVVANLKARTIRGEVSEGMLLAATVADGDQAPAVALISVPDHVPPGSTVG